MAKTPRHDDVIFVKVLDVLKSLKVKGVEISTELATLAGLTSSVAELNLNDGAAPGVVLASKAAIYDAVGKLFRSSLSPAAAGSSITDATTLTAELNAVTGANDAKGVKLPVAAADEIVIVINTDTTHALLVYPVASSQINALGASNPVTLPASQSAIFIGRSATLWYCDVRSVTDLLYIYGITASAAELNLVDTAVAGTVVASKAAVYDAAGKLFRSSLSPIAAGSSITDATALTAEVNAVTGANDAKGVKLPIAAADEIVIVINTDPAGALLVYPVSGSQINALGASNPVTLPASQMAIFVGRSTTLWYCNVRSDSELLEVFGITSSAAELNLVDTAVAGTVVASKTAIYDAAGKLYRSSASPAAAGGSISDATEMTAEVNAVIGADDAKGVKLPIAAADEIVIVVNTDTSHNLLVYPVASSQINALGASNPVTIPASQMGIFVGRSATLWYCNVQSVTDLLEIYGITASAAELNVLDADVAGVMTAGKPAIPTTGGVIDQLDITALKIGGVSATPSVVQQTEQMVERTFVETAGAGTYTATVVIPLGATVEDVMWKNTVVWDNAGTCVLNVGDDDDADGYFDDVDVKTVPAADVVGYGGASTKLSDTGAGVYKGKAGKYCAAEKTITATVVTSSTGGGAGRSRLLVKYSLPTTAAASKV